MDDKIKADIRVELQSVLYPRDLLQAITKEYPDKSAITIKTYLEGIEDKLISTCLRLINNEIDIFYYSLVNNKTGLENNLHKGGLGDISLLMSENRKDRVKEVIDYIEHIKQGYENFETESLLN